VRVQADIASAEQLNELEESIKQYEFTNCRGIFRVVAGNLISHHQPRRDRSCLTMSHCALCAVCAYLP
jgi:hypothetical protein